MKRIGTSLRSADEERFSSFVFVFGFHKLISVFTLYRSTNRVTWVTNGEIFLEIFSTGGWVEGTDQSTDRDGFSHATALDSSDREDFLQAQS